MFASVIAIWFVFSNGFSDVSVPFVFRLFLVRRIDGRRYRGTASCAILQVVFSEWVVVVIVVIFSRVSDISDTVFFLCVCVFVATRKGRSRRVRPGFSTHFFGPRDQHLQVCFHFECGRGSLQAWTVVGSVVVMNFSVSGS